MTHSSPSLAATRIGGGGQPARHRPLIAAFAITQTVGYGVLYYAFAVLLVPMTAGLHASIAQVTGALTFAVLISAAASVPVGRWLDRHGGRALMTAGSLLGTAAVAAWSRVDNVVELYAVFALMGLASAMVLYESAFAVIVRTVDTHRRASAILAVTIVAGFASSIFFPLTGALTRHLDWRDAILVLAAIHGMLTIPLHAFVVPARDSPGGSRTTPTAGGSGARHAMRDRGFWLLVASFSLQGAAMATVAVHLVACLIRLGHPAVFATTTAGLLGVLSVTGRLLTTGLRRTMSVATITATVFAIQGVAIAALPALGHSSAGAIVCVVAFGLGFGVASISRPALNTDRYGTTAYATISGAQNLPIVIARATAPLAAAALYTTVASYTPVMAATAAACLVAAACLLALNRTRHTERDSTGAVGSLPA
ncbi:MFS transporter [Longispora sp. K20-0274]|uniref:MFS transporter n=1 Tax=Longispora sp. K20-0274 TaxID=3088255 RepID=UPI00399A0C40